MVQELSAELLDAPRTLDRLVDRVFTPARGAAVVQPDVVVGIPVRAANPLSEVVRNAGDLVAADGGTCPEQRLDLGGQRRGHALVGIEGENPVIRGEILGMVLLRAVAGPVAHLDAGHVGPCALDRVVGAVGVDEDDLVGPRHRLQRLDDVRTFVVGDDRNGQLRHTRSIPYP
jgi:hypothetical protein